MQSACVMFPVLVYAGARQLLRVILLCFFYPRCRPCECHEAEGLRSATVTAPRPILVALSLLSKLELRQRLHATPHIVTQHLPHLGGGNFYADRSWIRGQARKETCPVLQFSHGYEEPAHQSPGQRPLHSVGPRRCGTTP